MKNKESFLKELQNGLAVLEEAEQQDILAEYAQHIDLRVAGGLTEEEAIRDFGDISQLTAEILEAYHVNPGYGKKAAKPMPDPRPALRKGAAGAGAWFRRWGGKIKGGVSWLGRSIAAAFRRMGAGVKGLFRRPGASDIREEEMAVKPLEKQEKREERRVRAGDTARRAGSGVKRFCLAVVRLAWNLALLLCAVPFAVLGLAALVCLGLLLVLLVQGYPLAGAALVCLGGLACCVGLLGLCGSLIWHRKAVVNEEVSHDE